MGITRDLTHGEGYPETGSGLRAGVITVNPEFAEYMVENGIRNRPISNARVRYYKKEIENRNWELNGETIIISEDGKLLDGYHRFSAVAQSGVPIKALVVWGVPRSVFDTMGQTKKRSMSDVLYIDGEKFQASLSRALSVFLSFDKGLPGQSARPEWGASPAEQRRLLSENPGLRQSVIFVHNVLGKRTMPKGLPTTGEMSALHYIFQNIDSATADWFIERLIDGTNLPHMESPLYVARDRLINPYSGSAGDKGSRLHGSGPRWRLAVVVKAWNCTYTGKDSVKRRDIAFKINEKFPNVAGLE